MSDWKSVKAKRLLATLERIGWRVKRQTGSHKILERPGWTDVVFAFHDGDEIGPKMLARVAKITGLKPEDL
jgi:predicted RNA binding protein YcfA (HicA-like mRNA interferase family)